jgi:hypothetical protein
VSDLLAHAGSSVDVVSGAAPATHCTVGQAPYYGCRPPRRAAS